MRWHGPHQDAVKSTTTALPRASASVESNSAFVATLRGPQGGEVEQAVERELAVRRVSIVGLVIAPAPSPAHVKMKDLFRFIREHYPDVVRHTRTHDRPSVDQPYQR